MAVMGEEFAVYGRKVDLKPWLEREKLELSTLNRVFSKIQLEGLRVLDAGTGMGYSAKYLAQRIGSGVLVTVDIDPGSLDMLRKLAGVKLIDKLIFIKADLRNLDFVKADYFDLICLYYTIHTIESTTPGGVKRVLEEMHRVLKPGGLLVAVENYATFEPIDDAHRLMLKFSLIEKEINSILAAASDIEYDPKELCSLLEDAGFHILNYKDVGQGCIDPTLLSWVSYLIDKAKSIQDQKTRREILARLKVLLEDAKKTGIRDAPSYAIYAKKE